MPERLVIANTSPLFYLHQIGHLEILHALYRRVVIPPAVQAELAAGGKAGFATPDISQAEWIEVRRVRSQELIPAVVDLGPGEAEVLALGLENPGSLLVLDDRLGRRVAHLNSLPDTGTVGVLVKAKQAGHVKAIRPLIQQLRATGLWLADDLVAMVLDQANE